MPLKTSWSWLTSKKKLWKSTRTWLICITLLWKTARSTIRRMGSSTWRRHRTSRTSWWSTSEVTRSQIWKSVRSASIPPRTTTAHQAMISRTKSKSKLCVSRITDLTRTRTFSSKPSISTQAEWKSTTRLSTSIESSAVVANQAMTQNSGPPLGAQVEIVPLSTGGHWAAVAGWIIRRWKFSDRPKLAQLIAPIPMRGARIPMRGLRVREVHFWEKSISSSLNRLKGKDIGKSYRLILGTLKRLIRRSQILSPTIQLMYR